MSGDRQPLDSIELAVLSNRFEAAVLAMMNTLLRTARSGVINNGRDFSCCVVTGDDELLAMAESQPIHVLSGPDLMAKAMKRFHPGLRRGDAFLNNSPYHGNSHAADHTVLVPVIDDGGRHRFTVLAKAHQADCGNASPTTYAAEARDVYEEGAPIFPCVRVQDDYRDVDDVIRMCRMRIRVPDQWWADYLALVGAARIGERRVLALGEQVGWDVLEEYTRGWFHYSERRMEAAIRRLPAGRTAIATAHDPFPGVPDGIPITVGLQVRSDEGRLEVDLRDNPDCQPCGLNLTEATARTAAMLGIFNAIGRDVPPNAGSFRRLAIHLRENCVVGIPRHPVSCSVATTNLADRVANAVQRGLAELCDGVGLAEVGLSLPAAWGVISGVDPRPDGGPFINQLILSAVTGGSGGPDADGWLMLGGIGDAGQPFRDSVEIDELAQPIRIVEQRIVPDSEGPGRHRGAPAAYVEYGPVDTSLEVMFASDGSLHPARGARGGSDGAPAQQFKRRADGTRVALEPYERVLLGPGETVISVCCSGGGYGDPRERDPELVRRDVAEGWVTAERARAVYGVELAPEGGVDAAATARLRAAAPG
jgi:N-methylhydantoinase B/oxoprolinase/acetone carboxylase alpha subunit